MELPQFKSYSAKNGNTLVFTLGDVDVYFSYRTPVAFRAPSHGLVVRANEWGPTTGKHLAAIDGGSKEARSTRVTETQFETMLADALGD